ncbi:MAG: ankyrin repeat domain-containing protein [Lachnospiraceae bacterium]|nr:ankyrin repeat domain-containing protein [Lachnospiraceae bacterium]
MKKLFKAIRNEDLEAVKAIIKKEPSAIQSIAVPSPKKDIGQSPLQVAVKIGAFEIAYYLMEQGADVNFMEEEAEGTQLRCPLLQDAIRTALISLCYQQFESSEKGVELVQALCERGADPNLCASNGFDAINLCVSDAEGILERQEAYPNIQDVAEQQLIRILDILIAHGADFQGWASRGHFPPPDVGETNRVRYLDDFIPAEDRVQEMTIRGKKYTTVIKGDVDRTAHTRAVMQRYCRDRNL